MSAPAPEMLAVAEKLASFIAGGGKALPDDLFAPEITIVENFPPFIFREVEQWSAGMRAHLADLSGLTHRFGQPIDFAQQGDDVYVSLPTTWTGLNRGVPFTETGGWGLVLTRLPQGWRLKGYGWAVVQAVSGK